MTTEESTYLTESLSRALHDVENAMDALSWTPHEILMPEYLADLQKAHDLIVRAHQAVQRFGEEKRP